MPGHARHHSHLFLKRRCPFRHQHLNLWARYGVVLLRLPVCGLPVKSIEPARGDETRWSAAQQR
jgi:hypothetical protein